MQKELLKLENQLKEAEEVILNMDKDTLNFKISEGKWSKKEILGHLIDSAINNLQRFTEVQFEPQPYIIRKYDQNELVKANNYQENEIETLLKLWISLNSQIIFVVRNLNPDILNYSVALDQKNIKTLEWFICDYVEHTEHHLKQIKN